MKLSAKPLSEAKKATTKKNNASKKPKINTASRVERCVIKETDDFFPVIMDYCHKSKNLYNHANYVIRLLDKVLRKKMKMEII